MRDDGAYDDIDDTSTDSYRAEQGKPERDPTGDRMRHVPITFGSDGAGGIVGRAPEPAGESILSEEQAAENQRAVEEGARWLESGKGE